MTRSERIRSRVISAIIRRSNHHDGAYHIADAAAKRFMEDIEVIVTREIALAKQVVPPSAIPDKPDPLLYSALSGYCLDKRDRLAKEHKEAD